MKYLGVEICCVFYLYGCFDLATKVVNDLVVGKRQVGKWHEKGGD